MSKESAERGLGVRVHGTAQIEPNGIYLGDALDVLRRVAPESVALSVTSPPYGVGKEYEAEDGFDEWASLIWGVVGAHRDVLRPGGFLVVNIADVLCFSDDAMPRFRADVVSGKRSPVTAEQVREARESRPGANRHELAAALGCSEQTIDRRLNGNNARGAKAEPSTRVLLTAPIVEKAARDAGLYLYDRRTWVKDPAWANSRWTSTSYRAVDEAEHLLFFWKPGVTRVDRARLEPGEWGDWGSRAVWRIPSVRANAEHPAMFPPELPRRVIRLLTDPEDVVLDPFVGSGTTAAVARELGRRFIGIDAEPRYVEMATKRLEAA